MIIRVCAFTTKGRNIADILAEKLYDCVLETVPESGDMDDFIGDSFNKRIPVIFIGAMGIAVRKIAPFVNDKLTDSPVVVIDENGEYVIPVLSNHLGGANDIAVRCANALGGQVVVTTATDVSGTFAIDIFAKNNGLKIVNREGIKRVSSKILEQGNIKMAIDPIIEVDASKVPDCIQLVNCCDREADVFVGMPESDMRGYSDECLKLIFKPYILGLGCKKNTDFIKFETYIEGVLSGNAIDEELVSGMASIDLKQKELCFLYYEAKHRIPFKTFSAEELLNVEGDFCTSDFVKEVTGVSNVCERSAVKMAGDGAELIVKKCVGEGMTLAVCRRRERIDIWKS